MGLIVFDRSKLNFSDFILPILALIGVLLSVELTVVYFNANFVPGAGASFCSLNSVIDCDAVAKTQFSAFLGIPLSVYGLGYYLAALMLSLFPFINTEFIREFRNNKSYIFTLATISVIVSVILAYISTAEIHKICILCYATYIVNLLIFLSSKPGAGFMEHYANTIKDIKSLLSEPMYMLFAIMITVFMGSAIYFINFELPALNKLTNDMSFSGSNSRFKSSGNILGSKKPAVIIKEYTDFQCPYCALSNFMVHRLVVEVPGVQVIHHDFPLGGQCNPKFNNKEHKYSCMAALYSRAAEKQGKLWEMNDLLFENQRNLNEANILKLAQSIGLDIEKLKQDAHNPLAMEKLRADITAEQKLGIDGTPAYIINGKKYLGLQPYSKLKEITINAKGSY